jgi:hypothetical protein
MSNFDFLPYLLSFNIFHIYLVTGKFKSNFILFVNYSDSFESFFFIQLRKGKSIEKINKNSWVRVKSFDFLKKTVQKLYLNFLKIEQR